MKLSLQELRKLVNQEIKKFPLHEKRKKLDNEKEALSEETREEVEDCLDGLLLVSEESEDPNELKWYLTKIAEMFGMEYSTDEDDEEN